MASAAVLYVSDVTDSAAIETELNTWLTANSAATIESVDFEQTRGKSGQIVVVYSTA